MVRKTKHPKQKLTQEELYKKSFEPPPLIGKRQSAPPSSYVLNRLIQLGLAKPQESHNEALIKSQVILSQLLKPNL